MYRRLYDEMFGSLEVSQIRGVADDNITVLFEGAKGSMAEIRFDLDGADDPKIAGIRVAQVNLSMR